LGEVRHAELANAAAALGVGHVELLDHSDGALRSVPLDRLGAEVARVTRERSADLVLVFDEGGVTGHPDHARATEAALYGATELPVLAWTIPRDVADTLNAELGTAFVGRTTAEIDVVVTVDREAQSRAIACHVSQSVENLVLARRLELQGEAEWLRWLRAPSGGTPERALFAPAQLPSAIRPTA
jgi:LmbE family N-acetylglucosaminyl deacetylase